MNFVEESILVRPDIGLLNRYAQKAREVAFTSVTPIFHSLDQAQNDDQKRNVSAFLVQAQGPSRYMSYFKRLIEGSDLKI